MAVSRFNFTFHQEDGILELIVGHKGNFDKVCACT